MRVALYTKLRVRLVCLFCMILYSGIAVRLVWLQIGDHLFFVDLGNRQYTVRKQQPSARGIIYDRRHRPLALNIQVMSAVIHPSAVRQPDIVYAFIKEHFPDAYERLAEQSGSNFFYIARSVSAEQIAAITDAQRANPALADIILIPEYARYYAAPHCGPIVGITTVDNSGAFGLERDYDRHLAGIPATFLLYKDARCLQRYYFDKRCLDPGVPGKPLYTTLDSTVQSIAYEELAATINRFGAQEGMVIVMEPYTGDIIAMVSYPDFDPNDRKHLCMEHTRNKCVGETYEFGSVMKIFLALAALAEGVVTPDTDIDCFGVTELQLHGMHLTTWKAHGKLTFSEVIQYSNNIGTAQVAELLKERLYDHYIRCGFGTKTGLFPSEQAGHVTAPSTWCAQSLASLSYGYEVRATLLQLACAWCMIATRGKKIVPRIIYQANATSGSEEEDLQLYDPAIIEQLRAILKQTVKKGTARYADIAGYSLIGKTGTANLLIDGVYNKERNIYTFSGAIDHGEYHRVIITCVKDAASGRLYASTVAAPLFERIVERMVLYDGLVNRLYDEGGV